MISNWLSSYFHGLDVEFFCWARCSLIGWGEAQSVACEGGSWFADIHIVHNIAPTLSIPLLVTIQSHQESYSPPIELLFTQLRLRNYEVSNLHLHPSATNGELQHL